MHSKEDVSTVISRLKAVVGVSSDKALSEYFGGHSTLMSNKKVRGSIPFEEAVQVALEMNVSLDWLILGKGEAPDGISYVEPQRGLAKSGTVVKEMPRAYLEEFGELTPSSGPVGPGYSAVPMYDIEAAAGSGRLFDAENIESTLYFETVQLQAEGLDPAQVVGAKVRGDSMGDTLRDGDKVLVDRSQRKPDGVFLLRMDSELRIKRVQRVAGGALMLISDNTHYEREMVRPQDMGILEIIGRCEIRIGRIA